MTTDENLSMTPDNDKAPQRRKRPRKGPIVGILLLLFLLAGIGAGATNPLQLPLQTFFTDRRR